MDMTATRDNGRRGVNLARLEREVGELGAPAYSISSAWSICHWPVSSRTAEMGVKAGMVRPVAMCVWIDR
jgi:hypothetical protein